ncbi:tetratricopeptide repeat protein [Streptomyces sp. NBC_01275]|uniref:tetratricopeptide repeat protein n=1 Tax=Streptomyces sp. NBC_01275 TaxID=2903807 RepID=UPI002253EEB5|nr:tetratricopeptide repeat protein [Streptomyces sp. NBC_01275]MCX4761130.1 tetratricopeptide repeat protein [Streptomyces sp. NBC_01275]
MGASSRTSRNTRNARNARDSRDIRDARDARDRKLRIGLYTATTGSAAVLPIVADHADGAALWAVVGVTGVLAALSAFFTRHAVTRTAPSSDEGAERPYIPLPPHNLPSLSRYFTGRDSELARIEEMLDADAQPGTVRRIVVIHGMGGAGKTQLALAHARTHAQADTSTLTWWLPATSTERLRDRLLELAAILGLPAHESEHVVLRRLWGWLRDNPGWLLVYDNVQRDADDSEPTADPPQGLQQFLPSDQCEGTILITTRTGHGWDELTDDRLELLGLAPEEGRTFLRNRIDGPPAPAASLDALGRQLGWLPLDLETAGAYIEREGISVEEYLGQLPEHTSTNGFETFQLSLEKISREAPEAEDLLRLCSYLASEDVPHATLAEHRAALPEPLRRAMGDDRVFRLMVRELVRHSLLIVTGDTREGSLTFGVHPRVRQFVRSRMDGTSRVQWSQAAVRLVEAAFPARPEQPETRSACERLMPHADAVITEVSWTSDEPAANAKSRMALIELLHRVGVYQEQRCNWTRALTHFQWEAELRQDSGDPDGEDPLGRITAQLAVARQHYLLAHLDEAHEECLKALEQCRSHTGDGPAFVELEALCHRQYGGVLREKILFDEALDAVREAIRIYESQEPGWESLEWAVAEQEIGMIHRNAGRLSLALESYAHAEARIPQHGSQVPARHVLFRAMLRWDVGIVAQDRGDLATAETMLADALAVFREHRGLEDFETSQVAKFLADVRRRQAEDLRERARATWHPLRRRELRRQGQEKLRSAADLLEPVLDLHLNRSEAEPHKYAACLNKMGSLQAAQGRTVEALETLDRAHRIYTQKYGSDHHYRAKTLSRLGPVLLVAGDRATAELVLREAERIFRARLGDHHPSLVAVYERLTECTDDPAEAADLRARAQRIKESLWLGGPPWTDPPALPLSPVGTGPS